ncbi:hypothetical protein M086_0216, partial [Bacteroides fragilis str. S13 L11]
MVNCDNGKLLFQARHYLYCRFIYLSKAVFSLLKDKI